MSKGACLQPFGALRPVGLAVATMRLKALPSANGPAASAVPASHGILALRGEAAWPLRFLAGVRAVPAAGTGQRRAVSVRARRLAPIASAAQPRRHAWLVAALPSLATGEALGVWEALSIFAGKT